MNKVTSTAILNKVAACQMLSISKRTLENLVARGELPPGVRVGKMVYWRADILDTWREQVFGPQVAALKRMELTVMR